MARSRPGRCLLLRTLYTVVLAVSVKLIIDRVVAGGETGSADGIVVILAAGYLVSAAVAVVAGYLAATAGARILADVRTASFEHLQRLSVGYHAQTQPGDILARFSSDVAQLSQGVIASPTRALHTVLALAMFLPVVLALEWRLTLLAMVAMPLAIIIARGLTIETTVAAGRSA